MVSTYSKLTSTSMGLNACDVFYRLGNIEASLQQQLALIRTLAACVKKQQLQNVSVNDNLDEEVAFQEEKAEIELEAEREAEREAEQEVTSTEQLDGDDVV